jgi:SAM-dependent methyltransferase
MQFCKIADITDWQDPAFQAVADLLHCGRPYRKQWEFIQVYRGLQELGLLNESVNALGLGSGRECLIYAFTNVCGSVTATDLYNSQNWRTAAFATEQVYRKNLFPYRPERLIVRHMDMTQIEFPDNQFDFVWSCCAVEHVNNFSELHRVYQEIHRVLKPGGIAAITTEYNQSQHHYYEPNMLFTDPYWMEQWLSGANPLIQGFELVDSPDFSLKPAPENQPQPKYLESLSQQQSIPGYAKDIVRNSIAFFLRKTGEFTRAYDESWLPPELRIYFNGCDQQRLGNLEAAATQFRALVSDETVAARTRTAATRHLVNLLIHQNQTETAIACCQAMLPVCLQSENPDHLLPLTHQYRNLEQWEAAKALYSKIIQLPGANANQVVRSLLGYSDCMIEQQQPELALQMAEKALIYLPAIEPNERLKVQFQRGFCTEKLGNWEGAIAFYQEALNTPEAIAKLQDNCRFRIEFCQEEIRRRSLLYRARKKLSRLLQQ